MIIPALLLAIAGLPPGSASAADSPPPAECQRGLCIAGTAFSPADLASATQEWDSFSGEPTVLIRLSETGRTKFERLQQDRVGEVLDIRIDGEIVSSPILREIILGGELSISGVMSQSEAVALAQRIKPTTNP